MFDQDRLRADSIRAHTQRFLPLILALWLLALVPAGRKLMAFEWTTGATGLTPTHLTGPISNGLSQNEGHSALLVVAIHPLCSCTRATLKELEDAAPNWKQPYRTTFLIYKSKPQPDTITPASDFDWHHAAYIRDAQKALNAEVVDDLNGEQAAKLGALTSGEVLLYSAPDQHGSRHLVFSGGVTAGRGMEGENTGIATLSQALNAAFTQPGAHAPVYGCGLAALSNSTPRGLAK
ncbi:hypothetical protein HDF16_002930 [Granulicella aggregans]|uniref:RedB protein n=1 Tax=Granulicella aggregans TaxID=474949 RepID=A0A7W8E478_9BACT|nr:hypothetical protein [Granulicella aggregans]MBB5058216.1 hypothetical protein [Granulicella aggregans]